MRIPENYPLSTSVAFWLENRRYRLLPYCKGWWIMDDGSVSGFIADRNYHAIASCHDGILKPRAPRLPLQGLCMMRSRGEEWFWNPGHDIDEALPDLLRRTAACAATAWVLEDELEALE